MKANQAKSRGSQLSPLTQAILGLSGLVFGGFLLAIHSSGGIIALAFGALNVGLAGVRFRDLRRERTEPLTMLATPPPPPVSRSYLIFAYSLMVAMPAYVFFVAVYYMTRDQQGMAFLAFLGGIAALSPLGMVLGQIPTRRRFAKGKGGRFLRWLYPGLAQKTDGKSKATKSN